MGKFGMFAGALLATVAHSVTVQAETIDIASAVQKSMVRSPEMGQMQARADAAEAAMDRAAREWFPKATVDAAVGLRHLANDTRVNLGLSAIDEKPLYTTIGVDQPVFDFGRRGDEKNAQKANFAVSQAERDSAGEAYAYNIARTYLQVLLQQRIAQAARTNVDFHTRLAADITSGVDQGALSISEKQQAEERRQSARVNAVQAENDLAAARIEFSLMLGTQDFDLIMPGTSGAFLPATLEEALAASTTQNQRLQAASSELDAAKWVAKRADAERLPIVNLRGTARIGRDIEGYRGETREYEVLLGLRWQFFDGGVLAARAREADRQEDAARYGLLSAERENEMQVRNGWQRLDTWRGKFAEQDKRRAVAVEVINSYQAQFGIGRRSLLDLLDAQNAWYNASTETEVARFGTLLAEYAILAQLNQLRAHFNADKLTVDQNLFGPR